MSPRCSVRAARLVNPKLMIIVGREAQLNALKFKCRNAMSGTERIVSNFNDAKSKRLATPKAVNKAQMI